jgi:hypothetical protein
MAIIDTPTEWQDRVLKVPEGINLAIFGGRGAGRTTGALFSAIRHCEVHGHGAHVIFIRQMLRSLREVEDNLHMMLSAQYGSALRVNRQDHIFVLPGGGTIEFSPINDTEDMAKLQGRSFSLLIADEYGNFSPQQMRFVDQLRANMRAGNIPCRFVLLANPGGRGHASIKERWIDRMIAGMPGVLEDGQLWLWLPANYKVNPHNPETYESSLEASALGDKELLRAWKEGAWNIARGAMFADVIDEEFHRLSYGGLLGELREDLQHMRRDGVPSDWKPTPQDWKMVGAYSHLSGDWGQSAPAVAFGCLRLLRPWRSRPRGSLILVDEVSSSHPDDRAHGMNWPIGRFAEEMGEMCDRSGIYRLGTLDDAKGLQPDDTLIKQMTAYQFSFERPRKNRTSGWAAMRELLFNAQKRNGKPGLWVTDRCAGWWETVPLVPRDSVKMEDVDTKSIDHWADANRYAAVYEVSEPKYNSPTETAKRYPTAAGPRPVRY